MSNQNGNSRGSPANKMLIDATHPEETRVVVLRNGRVEEFDYESAARKLLRGNIYLAKITRVEPSLQAAFVDYGGNRHGFLAFNEIHPDYYQIPVADRRALIEAEAQAEAEEEAAADRAAEAAAARRARRRGAEERPSFEEAEDHAVDVSDMLPPETLNDDSSETDDARRRELAERDERDRSDDQSRSMAERSASDPQISSHEISSHEVPAGEPRPQDGQAVHAHEHRHDDGEAHQHPHDHNHDHGHGHQHDHSHDHAHSHAAPGEDGQGERAERETGALEDAETAPSAHQVSDQSGEAPEEIETEAANEDVMEEVPVRPRRRLRSYKIQEVTKRRQVMLIQVVKEERGTKGAALTTYLSLAGRYTVLMPNTARGGGISRKITNPQDRKRLKAIAADLDVPEGMGLIIRTAGAARTQQEIKRDYEYLLRLWESVRELALSSNAPQLVYEEGNLIKRSIRDLYGKEVDEIVVAGEAAYKDAAEFMGMLMPSHARNVIHHQSSEPLFARYNLERQLNAMFSPYVHLRSGGYLVINQTEALVAIDINSGKSTREFSIEETALSTNLEAADEIARQVKLRDLAGLIVIDFIDMEEKRNNRAVERRIKDALRHDRARIQLGRISHFGLLEMSRQRMRTGVVEGSTTQCPHCQGSGTIRSTESIALAVLRGLEDALNAGPPANLTATTTATVALYILNNKRNFIVEMEERQGVTIQIQASDKVQGANFTIDRSARREEPVRRADRNVVNMDWGFDESDPEADTEEVVEEVDEPVRQERNRDRGRDRDRGRGRDRDGRGEREGRGDRGGRGEREGRGDRDRHVRGDRSEREAGSDRDDRGAERANDDRANDDRGRDRGERHAQNEDSGPGGDGRRKRRRRRRGRRGDQPGGEQGAAGQDQANTSFVGDEDGEGDRGPRQGDPSQQQRFAGDSDGGADDQVDDIATEGSEGENSDRDSAEAGTDGANGERGRRRRRRGRRGGRRGQERGGEADGQNTNQMNPSQLDANGSDSQNHRAEIGQDRLRDEAASGLTGGLNGPAAYEAAQQAEQHPSYEQAPATAEVAPAMQAPIPVAEVPAPEPVAAPKVEAPAEPAPRRAPPVASEPVLERVVVGPEQTTVQATEEPRPVRRGWWQRR